MRVKKARSKPKDQIEAGKPVVASERSPMEAAMAPESAASVQLPVEAAQAA